MIGYKEDEILEGLKKEDPRMIKFIYKKYFPSIKSMVYRFRNMVLDADDIFQEGITRSILIIRDGKFKEQSSYYTFLYSICRNICLKEIGKPRELLPIKDDYKDEIDTEDNFEQLNRLLKLKGELDEACRKIIDLRFGIEQEYVREDNNKLMRFDEVADRLELNVDNARQRFKRCMQKLKDEILNDSIMKMI